jgi:hypothetical protein
MAFDPSHEERQELLRDGWRPFMGDDLRKTTPEGTFWIGVPSGSRNRKYNVTFAREGSEWQLGSATTLRGALGLVRKKERELTAPPPRRSAPSRPGPKRRVGRKMVSIDWLQGQLDDEVLRGDTVSLDGEVYRVGNFIGDKVELWRE